MKKILSVMLCLCLFAGLLTAAPIAAEEVEEIRRTPAPISFMKDQFFVALEDDKKPATDFAESIGAERISLFKADSNIYLVQMAKEDENSLYAAMRAASVADGILEVYGRHSEYLNPVEVGSPYYDARTIQVKCGVYSDLSGALAAANCTLVTEEDDGWKTLALNDPINSSVFNLADILREYGIYTVRYVESEAYKVSSVLLRTKSDVRKIIFNGVLGGELPYCTLKSYDDGSKLYWLYEGSPSLVKIRELDPDLVWADYVYTVPMQGDLVLIDWYKMTDRLYPEQDGKIFAGWYTDSSCTVPYLKKTGWAYPKFVDADVHKLGYQLRKGTTKDSEKTDLRIITTVDSLSYQYIRFLSSPIDFNFDVKITTAYNRLLGLNGITLETYTPTMVSLDSKYFVVITIKNIPNSVFNQPIYVDVEYVTADGTIISRYVREERPGWTGVPPSILDLIKS